MSEVKQAFALESAQSSFLGPLSAFAGSASLPELSEADAVNPWLSATVQRRVVTAAGVAVAMTSVGTVVDLLHQPPQYEGTFTLNTISVSPSRDAVAAPQIQDTNQTLGAPILNSETQTRILRSPRFIEPVVAKLKTADPTVDYTSLTDKLEVTVRDNQQVEVRYRDTSPEKVQQVLEQLAASYVDQSQKCQSGPCKGIEFIEARLPALEQRTQEIRQQIQAFNQQNGAQPLQLRVRLLTSRETEVARQKAQLDGDLAQARLQYVNLQRRMALRPEEAIASKILSQNARYQALLSQFRQLNSQIAEEFKRMDDGSKLQPLYAQHQALLAQIQQEAAQALPQYLATSKPDLQNPLFQEADSLQLLQQSVSATYTLHVLEIRQQMLVQLQNDFGKMRSQLINQLKQSDYLQTQLKIANQTLQQYLDELDTLKASTQDQQVGWTVTSAPDLLKDQAGQPVSIQSLEIPWEIGVGATIGVALGVGTAAMMERRKGKMIVGKPQSAASLWDLPEEKIGQHPVLASNWMEADAESDQLAINAAEQRQLVAATSASESSNAYIFPEALALH